MGGVAGLSDYARIETYLSGLPGVSAVRLAEITPASLSYSITVQGGAKALIESLALGRVLIPATAASGAAESVLSYRLAP